MGLTGQYLVLAYEDWSIAEKETNFLAYSQTISPETRKTYIFYKDGNFFPITFEGSLGVWLDPRWTTVENKLELTKLYRKWLRKNR